MHGTLERLYVRLQSDPHDVVEEMQRVAREALELFAAAGDERGLARAWFALFWTDWLRSRAAPALASLEQALVHAERAGSHGLRNSGIMVLSGALIRGPLTPAEIRARRWNHFRDAGPLTLHTVVGVEAHLMDLEGRLDKALECHRRADELADDLGLETVKMITRQLPAETLFRQGRLEDTAALLRRSERELAELGHTSFRSTTLIELGLVLYASGELEEAERLAIEGEELGATEDVVNFAWGRSLRARIAADRGAHVEAASLATSALEYAYETDFPSVHAHAHRARAQVLLVAGRPHDARAELERAVERYESIGDVFELGRVRALLVEL